MVVPSFFFPTHTHTLLKNDVAAPVSLIQEPDLAILDVTAVTGDRVGADVWWDDFDDDDDGAPENKRKKERRKPGENAKIIHYYWH